MRLSRREFVRLVRQSFAELPPRVVEHLNNVDILVQDWPDPEDLVQTDADSPSNLLGLYTGVPLTEREGGPPALPDRITLFQRPIEAACASKEQMTEEIRKTLLHEVGHYLGIDEEALERLGYA